MAGPSHGSKLREDDYIVLLGLCSDTFRSLYFRSSYQIETTKRCPSGRWVTSSSYQGEGLKAFLMANSMLYG